MTATPALPARIPAGAQHPTDQSADAAEIPASREFAQHPVALLSTFPNGGFSEAVKAYSRRILSPGGNSPMTAGLATADATASGTNETAGARRDRGGVRDRQRTRPRSTVPYVVAGYPDAETSFAAALAAIDAGADLLEARPAVLGPARRRSHAPEGVAGRARNGATLDGSLTLIERIAQARPAVPVVPMGYANQFIGGGDGREAARRLANAGAAGVIVADLTPDEGGPFEMVARGLDLAVVYLVAPTTPRDRRAEIARRSGGFLYCVSLVGVTGARDALPTTVGRLVRDVVAASPVPVGVGFGVSRPAHVRGWQGPAPAASSSRRPWSTHWATMAATWIAWLAWSETSPLQRDAAHEGPCLH